MSKHYLATYFSIANRRAAQWITALSLACVGARAHAQTSLPEAYSIYNPLPTQTSSLSFGTGSSSVVRSDAASGLVEIGINRDVKTGTLTNGWSGTAAGSLNVTVVIPLYSSRATTKTVNGSLIFGSEATGALSGALNILGTASVLMTHTASKQIALTNTIATTGGSQRFAYNFDLAVNTGLLGLSNLGVLDSLTITAYSGTTAIASASVFSQVLGLTSLTNTFYDNARFIFDYNPTSGPLEIRWSTNVVANAGLLGLLNEGKAGTNNIYTITDGALGYLTPIPEPSSLLLCALGLGLLLRRKRVA